MSKILFDGLATLAQLDNRFEEILQSDQWKELKEYAKTREGIDREVEERSTTSVSNVV